MIYQTLPPENPTNGTGHNWLPAWSPDGQWLVFTSNRDGNPELYIMRRDGTETRRLTNHPAVDTSPTWSPAGRHIAFLSDRTGSPQIYVVGVDGLGLYRLTLQDSYCDRPTWSPAPFNEIAYTARTGPGYDIRIIDLATKERRQITFSEGSNESPAYAPNGRHMAFMSTRSGKQQIFTVGRDGRGLRQVTRTGNNHMPNWSQ
jgi:TolB protein